MMHHLRYSRRRLLSLMAAAQIPVASAGAQAQRREPLPRQPRWAAFYGHDCDPALLQPYAVLILDPRFQGSLVALRRMGVRTFGYVSAGEVERTSPSFAHYHEPSVLLRENPDWPGTFALDLRKTAARSAFLHRIAPSVLAQGFDGLFLDTLDTPPYLEYLEPESYRGLADAAVSLVLATRNLFPQAPFIVNRGYALLSRLLPAIDAVVAESMLSTRTSDAVGYRLCSDEEVAAQITLLAPARERGLPIYALDYWDPADAAGLRVLYSRERAMGHAPYVATTLLDRVVPEPA